MSDLLDTLIDGSVTEKKPAKDEIVRVDPVIFENHDDPDFIFFTPEPIKPADAKKLMRFLKNRELGDRIRVVSVLDHTPNLKNNIARYYRDNHVDLWRYLSPGTPVLAMGRAIYAFTHSDDLDVTSFYDYVFNQGWFYAPQTESYVFPIDPVLDWLGKDTFKKHFALKQIKSVKDFDPSSVKLDFREPILKHVSNPNAFLRRLKNKSGTIAWDLETVTLDPWAEEGDIICLTLTFDGVTGYYLPWKDIDVELLSDFFRSKDSIGSNLKYDVKWLVTRGVDRDALWISGDTQQLGHLLNEMRRNGLKPLSWIYSSMGGYDEPLDRYIEQYPKARENYSFIPTDILFDYAAKDPIATYRIYERQLEHLAWIDREFPVNAIDYLSDSTWSLERLYREIIVPALNTFADIELEGITLDVERLRETSVELEKMIEEKRREVYEALGVKEEEFNLDSAEQLGRLLQEKGWEKVERAKKGHYKTNDAILQKWSKLGHTEADLILEYRGLSTIMKTFVGKENEGTGFFQYVKKDGKVHGSFLVAMADSLRTKSRAPNLQNIPKRSNFAINSINLASIIRSFFKPRSDEFVIGESDGAGLQLTLEAQLTEDENMVKVFTELGGDMHSMSAQEIYMPELSLEEFIAKKSTDKDVKLARFDAKAVNFSLIFNTSSFSFAVQSIAGFWSLEKAKEYIDKMGISHYVEKREESSREMFLDDHEYAEEFAYYWAVADFIKEKFMNTYPGVAEHIERSIEFGKNNGYIRSPFGSIRRVPELLKIGKDDRRSHIKNLMNIVTNSPIQTMEAVRIYDTKNRVNRYIKENNKKTRLVGMVHDSILSFKHRDEVMEISRKEKEFFEEMWPENRGVPLTLEVEIADPLKNQWWGFGDEIEVKKARPVKRKPLTNAQ